MTLDSDPVSILISGQKEASKPLLYMSAEINENWMFFGKW